MYIEIHGNRWLHIDLHGYPRMSMDIHANKWLCMDHHGHPFAGFYRAVGMVGVGIGMLVEPSDGCSECWLDLAEGFGTLVGQLIANPDNEKSNYSIDLLLVGNG